MHSKFPYLPSWENMRILSLKGEVARYAPANCGVFCADSMNLRLLPAILLGLILLISACGPEPQIRSDTLLQDNSLITGEPCGPPCWRGIIPGETTWNDAIAIIEDDVTLDELQTRADDESDQIVAAWAQADGDGCCQMITQDGDTVSFLVLQTTPDMPLSGIIDFYGDPTYLIGELLSDSQGVFHLFYPEIPMLIYTFVTGEDGALSPESEVVGFGYMTDDLMQLVIDTADPGLHTWEGYRSYKYYVDGELEVTPSITVTPTPE